MALAECCISQQIARETPRLIGANIDLTGCFSSRLDALAFGESQSRVIVSAAPDQVSNLLGTAAEAGLAVRKIGTVGGSDLQIRMTQGTLAARLSELHDIWWNTIARAMM